LKRFAVSLALAASPLAFATPANAALVLGSTPCQPSNTTPTAISCQGWFQGNLNSGQATDLNDSATAVNALLGTSYTGATLPLIESIEDISSGNVINFAHNLIGPTLFSAHVGAANGNNGIGYEGTAFFLINAGTGLDTITLNVGGLSNARLFATSVPALPELATWSMMLVGFGAIGGFMRRSKKMTRMRLSYS